jgi:hypothetical protein
MYNLMTIIIVIAVAIKRYDVNKELKLFPKVLV